MRALIIDDELKSRELLKALIRDFCQDIEISGEASNVKEGIKAIIKHNPDIVFLDIEMPEEDGFALLGYYEDEIPFEVIFTTAYDEFALKAFEFSAIDYLLKPIDIERLQKSVRKAKTKKENKQNKALLNVLKNNLSKESPEIIALSMENGYAMVKVHNIIYCKAEGAYTKIFINNGTEYISSRGLSKFEELLENSGFYRVHRSYLINLSEITRYLRGKSPSIIMSNGIKLEVSATRKDKLLDFIRKV